MRGDGVRVSSAPSSGRILIPCPEFLRVCPNILDSFLSSIFGMSNAKRISLGKNDGNIGLLLLI